MLLNGADLGPRHDCRQEDGLEKMLGEGADRLERALYGIVSIYMEQRAKGET